MKRLFRVLATALVIGGASQAHAQLVVIDPAQVAQGVSQIAAWGQQYGQMAQQYATLMDQYHQAVTTYNSLSGVRGMASLVNNPAVRRYLPDQWSQAMNLLNSPGGYTGLQGQINSIRAAAQITGIGDTSLDATSDAAKAFTGGQNQVATNRALSEAGYNAASARIADIEQLIARQNSTPDAKDIADLQARIQGEQVMVQNELVKLQAMSQLQQAQRDLAIQQGNEISMQGAKTAAGIKRF